MSIWDRLGFSFLAKAGAKTAKTTGASQLPPEAPPKVKPKQASYPPSFPTTAPSESAVMIKRDLQLANSDVLALRRGATTAATIRDFSTASPDLSAAFSANLRLGISEGWKIKAWNPDGTFNPDATRLAYQIAQRMEMVPDYTEGFNRTFSFLSLSESLGKDLMINGAMAMELVLDKSRLPSKFVPLTAAQIVWYPDVSGKSVSPKQLLGGVYTDLDIPSFFYVALDQDLLTAYSESPFTGAVQPVVADAEFTNDMRRVVKRSVYPRLDITIDEEKLKATTPPEVLNDPNKLREYRNAVQADIGKVINGLQPEDALVHYDHLAVAYVDGDTHAPQDVFKGVQNLINAKLSTGARTLPSVLGHGSQSQNVASSETLLAMKTSDGMIRRKLNEMYSKGMTLAVRLFGMDVAVAFMYDEIDLRPTGELESFRSMKQARFLELLSFGMITNEEACLELTGSLPPPGMPDVFGTMFSQGLGKYGSENPYAGTSTGPGGGAMNQSLKPGTPTKTKGDNGSS